MKRSLLAVTMMLIMVVAASAGTVTGTVTDSTGAFVEGAIVNVSVDRNLCPGGRAFRTLTAADGSFTIENVPEGIWTMHAGKRQVGSVQQDVDVPEEGVVTVNLQLPGCDGTGDNGGNRRRIWLRHRYLRGGI